jgi:hypothetical protein
MDIALVLQAANRQSERCGKAFILLSQARLPAAPASVPPGTSLSTSAGSAGSERSVAHGHSREPSRMAVRGMGVNFPSRCWRLGVIAEEWLRRRGGADAAPSSGASHRRVDPCVHPSALGSVGDEAAQAAPHPATGPARLA